MHKSVQITRTTRVCDMSIFCWYQLFMTLTFSSHSSQDTPLLRDSCQKNQGFAKVVAALPHVQMEQVVHGFDKVIFKAHLPKEKNLNDGLAAERSSEARIVAGRDAFR